jgi:hypothetical protein
MNVFIPGRPLIKGLLWIVFLGLPLPLRAQAAVSSAKICGELHNALQQAIEESDSFKEQVAASAAIAADQLPKTSPASKQTNAPAAAGGAATTLVNGADFPGILAFAIDNGLLTQQGDLITGNFNLFDLKAIFRPEVLDRQTLYQTKSNENLRRWGVGLTFGGKGDSFDRDGDGVADPPLDAKNLGDIANWELRFRLAGTRDRRDRTNVDKFKNDSAVNASFTTVAQISSKLVSDFAVRLKPIAQKLDSAPAPDHCIDRAEFDAFLKDPEVMRRIAEIRADEAVLNSALDKLNEEIDRSLIVTLFVGGLERKDQFGPSKHSAGIRVAKGVVKDQGMTFNAEYTQTRSLLKDVSDPTMLKLGLEYGLLLLKGAAIGGKDGVHVALSGAYEKYKDVPDAMHDTVAKLNAKLELHLTDNIKIPLSVTWANHKDLLTDERDVRGHIGFSIDLTNALAPKAN